MAGEKHIEEWARQEFDPLFPEQNQAGLSLEEQEALQESSRILDASSRFQVESQKEKAAVWASIQGQISMDSQTVDPTSAPKGVPFWRKSSFRIGIAASLALLCLIGFLAISGGTEPQLQATGPGMDKTIVLPEGSKVHLNAGSELAWSNPGFNREVKLKGEAFFEVAPGSKFSVLTEHGRVEVLGTSFNVHARSGDLAVACKTGKVRVSAGKQQTILQPGMQVKAMAGKLQAPQTTPLDHIGSWQQKRFHFENATLQKVTDELERQFDLEITLNLNRNRSFTGQFGGQDLHSSLDNICKPLNLRYSISEDQKKVTIED